MAGQNMSLGITDQLLNTYQTTSTQTVAIRQARSLQAIVQHYRGELVYLLLAALQPR
jgi:hypothetical protein